MVGQRVRQRLDIDDRAASRVDQRRVRTQQSQALRPHQAARLVGQRHVPAAVPRIQVAGAEHGEPGDPAGGGAEQGPPPADVSVAAVIRRRVTEDDTGAEGEGFRRSNGSRRCRQRKHVGDAEERRVRTDHDAGLSLDEIPYWRDGTLEKYTPSGDYVVVKFARWAFEKFKGVEDRLGTQMRAVGEVMSIGKTYKEALQKAFYAAWAKIKSLEFNLVDIEYELPKITSPILDDALASPAVRLLDPRAKSETVPGPS